MRVRPMLEAEIHRLLRWFPDEAALVQWGGPTLRFPLDEPQLRAMMAEGVGETPRRWLLSGEEAGAMVAHAQVALDWGHGTAVLGRVGIDPAQRGRGLAAPFLRQVIERVFTEPGFERIELNVYTFNDAAIRTYRRLGFVQEGVRRSAVRVGSQRWDTAMFGLLRSEAVGLRSLP